MIHSSNITAANSTLMGYQWKIRNLPYTIASLHNTIMQCIAKITTNTTLSTKIHYNLRATTRYQFSNALSFQFQTSSPYSSTRHIVFSGKDVT